MKLENSRKKKKKNNNNNKEIEEEEEITRERERLELFHNQGLELEETKGRDETEAPVV